MTDPRDYSHVRLAIAFFCLLLFAGCSPRPSDKTEDGKTIVSFWSSWAGFERTALLDTVRGFNESQDRIFVKTLNISDPNTKIILATASGHPPDIAMLYYYDLPAYAANNALTPLNTLCQNYGIGKKKFNPAFWNACSYRDFLWGMPLTASVITLHYNKSVFREVGLDPEQPPRTLEDLEKFNEILSKRRPDGSIERLGHLPTEPGWWQSAWPEWFGGSIWDEERTMHLNSDEWQQTADWLGSYPKRFGARNIVKLQSSFGSFASPQNAFFTGKVAMVMQGSWMHNFITNFAPPNFDYGIAPFPTVDGTPYPSLSIIEPDCITIPAGAKHVDEAMEFISYLVRQNVLEDLALGHRKITALSQVSEEFVENHPHPYIETLIEIAKSPYTTTRAKLTNYNQHDNGVANISRSLVYGYREPEGAFLSIHEVEQKNLDRSLKRWDRVKETQIANWKKQ